MRRTHLIPEPRRTLYRYAFLGAAIYNVAWAILVGAFPHAALWLTAVPAEEVGPMSMLIYRGVGVFLALFAIGYWYLWRDPERFAPFAMIGLIGKVVAPLAFVGAWWGGVLPGRAGWAVLANDMMWWPAFVPFVYETVVRRRYEPR